MEVLLSPSSTDLGKWELSLSINPRTHLTEDKSLVKTFVNPFCLKNFVFLYLKYLGLRDFVLQS